MLAGHVAEQVVEPGVDVFDQFLPGRQQPGVHQGLADLAAGMAAGEGVEQLVGQRPVVAGQRGQDAGAVAAAPARSARFSGSPRRAAPRGSGARPRRGRVRRAARRARCRSAHREQHAAGQDVGRPAAAAAQVLSPCPGAGRADRPAGRSRLVRTRGCPQPGQGTGLARTAGSSSRRPRRSPTGRLSARAARRTRTCPAAGYSSVRRSAGRRGALQVRCCPHCEHSPDRPAVAGGAQVGGAVPGPHRDRADAAAPAAPPRRPA